MKVYLVVELVDLGYRVLHASLSEHKAQELLKQERTKAYEHHRAWGVDEKKALDIAEKYIQIEDSDLE
jgi:hypothetical protein